MTALWKLIFGYIGQNSDLNWLHTPTELQATRLNCIIEIVLEKHRKQRLHKK